MTGSSARKQKENKTSVQWHHTVYQHCPTCRTTAVKCQQLGSRPCVGPSEKQISSELINTNCGAGTCRYDKGITSGCSMFFFICLLTSRRCTYNIKTTTLTRQRKIWCNLRHERQYRQVQTLLAKVNTYPFVRFLLPVSADVTAHENRKKSVNREWIS